MKRVIVIFILLIGFFGRSATSIYAGTLSDNFDNGNVDSWWFGYSLANPSVYGNWRVDNGALVQDFGADGTIALFNSYQFSSQTIETKLKVNSPSGGSGVMFWFQNNNNLAYAQLSGNGVEIGENVNGTWSNAISFFPSFRFETWYNLKTVINSTNNNIDIYIDGNYISSHTLTTPNRVGRTGVITGNAGGYFDNFSIFSESIVDQFIDKSKCRNGSWNSFVNMSFKNQGNCINFLTNVH